MIKTLFLAVLEISLTASPIVVLFVLWAPHINKRYAAKWKYWIWIILALRLLIHFGKSAPVSPVVIDIPSQVTTPLMSHDAAESVLTLGEQVEVSDMPGEEAELSGKVRPKRMSVDISLLDLIAVVWLLGGLSILSVHGLGYAHFKGRIIQNGESAKDEVILCELQQLAEELQIRRKIGIIRYSQAASPLIIGFIHPILVIPDETYSQEELYFILKHELVHLKRHDTYYKLLLLVVNALHWFNPIVWFMRKEATVDMELSCDENVIWGMNLESRKAYVGTLLSALDRQYAWGTFLTTQFYGGKQVMEKRFKNILMGAKKKNGFSLVVCVAVLTLALGSLMGCSIKETVSEEISVENTEMDYSTGAVNVETLRVREEPEVDAPVIGLLPNGGEVTITEEDSGFYRILWEQEDGTVEGYVRKEYIEVE